MSRVELTRRDFLRLAGATTLGAGAAFLLERLQSLGLPDDSLQKFLNANSTLMPEDITTPPFQFDIAQATLGYSRDEIKAAFAVHASELAQSIASHQTPVFQSETLRAYDTTMTVLANCSSPATDPHNASAMANILARVTPSIFEYSNTSHPQSIALRSANQQPEPIGPFYPHKVNENIGTERVIASRQYTIQFWFDEFGKTASCMSTIIYTVGDEKKLVMGIIDANRDQTRRFSSSDPQFFRNVDQAWASRGKLVTHPL